MTQESETGRRLLGLAEYRSNAVTLQIAKG